MPTTYFQNPSANKKRSDGTREAEARTSPVPPHPNGVPSCVWKWSHTSNEGKRSRKKEKWGDKGERMGGLRLLPRTQTAEEGSYMPFASETEKTDSMPRPTSCKPICSAKWPNLFNNSKTWTHPGLWSGSQTPIWTNQLGLYFWLGSCVDINEEEIHLKKQKPNQSTKQKTPQIPAELENRVLRKYCTNEDTAKKPRNEQRQIHSGNYVLKATNLVPALELTVSC